MPINKDFSDKLFNICNEVINELNFKEKPIEFYISSDPEINSSAIYNYLKESPHKIILNRGLIEKLKTDELKFVIGHEIGHLIYNHYYITRILQTIYPNYNDLPSYLQHTYEYWRTITEISSDRVGLLASKNFDSSIRAIFKISSGLSEDYYQMDSQKLLEITNKIYEETKNYPSYIPSSYPTNPIRIMSLKFFYESNLWKSIRNSYLIDKDEELDNKMLEIIKILRKFPINDLEKTELLFLISAGIYIMASDKNISDLEYNFLLNMSSWYIQFPEFIIDDLMGSDYLVALNKSTEDLLNKYPWRIRPIISLLVNIITVDRKLKSSEIELFFEICKKFKMPIDEIVDILLDGIKKFYKPLY